MTELSTDAGSGFTQAEIDSGAKNLQFATFRLSAELFGINILQVQEILLTQNITPVPLAAEHVLGLIGLRGQIVTAVDLKRRIGLPIGDATDDPYHMVVNAYGSVASLQVDLIGDVLEMPSSDFHPPPDSLQGIDKRYLEGVFMLDEAILAIVDLSTVLDLN